MDSSADNVVHLGRDIYLTTNIWNGRRLIHIRQFHKYSESATKMYPVKDGKGVCLSLENYLDLQAKLNEICDAFKNECQEMDGAVSFKHHIGGNMYISKHLLYDIVNIRRWFIPGDAERIEENLIPTKKGIGLTIDEWKVFSMEGVNYLQTLPEIKNGIPCNLSDSHQNQLGMLMCPHCNPNDCNNW